jgi:hypothetical protein
MKGNPAVLGGLLTSKADVDEYLRVFSASAFF